ncbi:hypothetical protein, partial [Enorma massiliensis]|uniref:hypothetical protein n=1 Tax=Enorma massiliensis TaxID=1472761 RepID=UPI003AF0C594
IIVDVMGRMGWMGYARRKEMNFATHFCLSMRVDTLRSSKSSKSSKRSQRERGIYCCVFL